MWRASQITGNPAMSTSKQTVIFLLIISALAAGFYFGRTTADGAADSREGTSSLESNHEETSLLSLSPEAQSRLGIESVEVKARRVQQFIETTGTVKPDETRIANVHSAGRGRINQVYVRLGDRVEAGQPLLRYDNVELGEVLGQYVAALAELERSKSAAEVARQALERARSLVNLGAIAKAELERREAEFQNVLSESERRRAEAAQLEEKLHRFGMTDSEIEKLEPRTGADYHRQASYSVLRAPCAGVITSFNAAPGESVDRPDELMTIADLRTVWVQADVFEKDLRLVREGSTAEVRVGAHPDQLFKGKVTYVADVLDPYTRTAKVRIEVPNPDNLLKVEMFATVRIATDVARPALMVPAEAVHKLDDQMAAFVKLENGFERRNLQLGPRIGEWVTVVEGLKEGESVVTKGSFLLKSEAKKAELGHHHED